MSNLESLIKKYCKQFQKSMILKAFKKEILYHPYKQSCLWKTSVKVRKSTSKQNKRPHNLETLKLIHTKFGALSQISSLLNYGNISSLSRKHWGISYPKCSTLIV